MTIKSFSGRSTRPTAPPYLQDLFAGPSRRRQNLQLFFIAMMAMIPIKAMTQAGAGTSPDSSSARQGIHDFDFEIGTWKTHLSRLLHPLTGSNTWVEYNGVTVVRKVWNGRANLVELVADGPAGHFEGLSLRLYNPESRQWSLNFASIKSGTLSPPAIGEFKDGRGEFYSQETLDGRAILVRFVILSISTTSCHFEQAFSNDGGRTWEVNWIVTDTRIPDAPEKKTKSLNE